MRAVGLTGAGEAAHPPSRLWTNRLAGGLLFLHPCYSPQPPLATANARHCLADLQRWRS